MNEQNLITRRAALQNTACGFGALAAQAMASGAFIGGSLSATSFNANALAAKEYATHIAPRAKRIIFLFMQGGVSQVDSFDYKPTLAKTDGNKQAFDDARTLAKTGKRATEHRVMKSPWRFQQYGESGRWVSELFPESAQHVDKLCMLHGLHTEGVAHGPSTLFLHCGSTNFIRPSFGSWVLYGLGSENENLPGFISIAPSVGNGGPRNYGSAFLPAKYQGTRIGGTGKDKLEIESLNRSGMQFSDQREQFQLLQELNRSQIARRGLRDSEFDALVDSYDLAWRMQSIAPEVLNIENESEATLKLYGIDRPETKSYGQKCLLARRAVRIGR